MSEENLYKGKQNSKPNGEISSDSKSDINADITDEKSEQNISVKKEDNNNNEENPYLNNPLHGVGLKTVLEELVSHYGFDILYAYLNINCFRSNPSVAASAKFLKNTDWAREKVEVFYLYQFKNLPSVSSEQFKLAPRERIVPEHHTSSEPAILSIEDGERLQDKRDRNAASRNSHTGERKGSSREYNEQRSAGYYKSQNESPFKKTRDNTQSSKPSYYKSDDKPTEGSSNDNADSNPAPPKDPWGNFKGGK
ncbi:MAG: VF530 family protein [Cocleimonas sp.]